MDLSGITAQQIFASMQDLAEARSAWELKVKIKQEKFDKKEEELTGMMLKKFEESGVEEMGFGEKRLTKKKVNRYGASDRDVFANFVRSTGNIELLEMRPAQTNCQVYEETHGEAPPGLSIFSKIKLVTTKRKVSA